MISISMCMIVKNEEKTLERCLSTLVDLVDEFIIVDTGSTDRTKEIALRYTDVVYDFPWINDFSAARNFAFSKATKEYIYTADADETIDQENRERFLVLKENLLPEIEIVQMYYCNQLKFNTVYNYNKEYRPKLLRRNRTFSWMDAIHETIRTAPIVFDSEIEIHHEPEENHAARDLIAFRGIIEKEGILSSRLYTMYARELFMAGELGDLEKGRSFFERECHNPSRSETEIKQAASVVAKAARANGDTISFMKYAMKAVSLDGCAEVCSELGRFYLEGADYEEAAVWFYNAAYETESVLDIRCKKEIPLLGLAACCEKTGLKEDAEEYRRLAKEACEASPFII